jgi:mono/diheme cytochrome c family protein
VNLRSLTTTNRFPETTFGSCALPPLSKSSKPIYGNNATNLVSKGEVPVNFNAFQRFSPAGRLAQISRIAFAQEIPAMRNKKILLFFLLGASVAVLGVIAQQAVTEAPAGFATPTLGENPGTQSTSNGIAEPSGDTFALDQAQFERRHDQSTGLGPVFNATACAECHQNGVTGAASQITEIRAGHRDRNGNFTNPTVPINGGANLIAGRSIINDRSICPQAQEHVPDSENVRAFRAVLSTLGDGFVEAVDDRTLLAIAANQPAQSNGMIHGEAVQVPILEAPGHTGVGRFGWKDQDPTILSFAGDAYLNEMGVTNRLKPTDVTSVCKVTSDLEDTPDDLGLADIDHFAQFIRGTQVPPRDTPLASTPDAVSGEHLFAMVGCSTCHVSTMTTDPAGTKINGGSYTVPEALGSKIIHPFGDPRRTPKTGHRWTPENRPTR